MKKSSYKPSVFQHQASAELAQAAPVINDWYDILPATTNIKLFNISFEVADTGENLECRLIIDGQTYTGTQAGAVADTDYWFFLRNAVGGITAAITTANVMVLYNSANHDSPIEGRSVQVSLRKTSANGAGNLNGSVMYERMT